MANDKKATIKKFATKKGDTGSAEVQIAIFTDRIESLKEHLNVHPKDNHSRRWILLLVAKRRKMLNYLKKKDIESYEKILKELKIRK